MDTVHTPETPEENNAPPAAQLMAPPIEPRAEVREETVEKAQPLRADRGHFAPGTPAGPGRPKGRKDNATIINDAKIQLLADILTAQPSKRFYKKWLKNYAVRHPKEALELIASINSRLDPKDKGDTHLHFNLAELVARAGKKQEAEKLG